MTRLIAAALLLASSSMADVRLPPYTRQVLPNGIVLDVLPRHDVPLVTIRVVVKGGIESDPEKLAGLSAVTAEAIRRGTATRTADQFSRELDELGATFLAGADMQSTSVSSEFLSKDFSKGLELVLDALTHPSFPETEIKKLIGQRIDSSRSLKDNPAAAASEYYRSFFFGAAHAYGRPADELSLSKMDRNAIVEYHKRMYVGRNMIVVIAGDVEPASAVPAAVRALSSIPAGTAYAWQKAPKQERAGMRVAVIDKPDATETQVRIGMPGIERTDPDRIPLWLVNTLFGGRFTSILNDELRVNSGLTYGAGSLFDQTHMPGRITISTFTATASTGKVVDTAIRLLKRTAEKGITAEQLASAKAYLKGTYPADRLETADQLAGILGDIELFDLNRGEVDDLFSRIDAVTVEKANETARKLLTSDKLRLVLLGNASKFIADLHSYDAQPVQVPITQPGLQVSH